MDKDQKKDQKKDGQTIETDGLKEDPGVKGAAPDAEKRAPKQVFRTEFRLKWAFRRRILAEGRALAAGAYETLAPASIPRRERRANPQEASPPRSTLSCSKRVRRLCRYASPPSPAVAPAAAAALSAARFLWLRQPVQNTNAIPAAPATVTPMRILSTACRP